MWMDQKISILSEVCQTEKDKHYIISHMESKKNDTSELICKTEKDHRHRNYGYQRGNGGRREKLEGGDWHIYTTVYKVDK